VKRFDQLKLAEAPFNRIAYSSDRKTFGKMAPAFQSQLIIRACF